MMLLTDVAIEHVYKGKQAEHGERFVLHPFTQSVGEHRDHYEVIGTRTIGGRKSKKSLHVTEGELAELFARGLFDSLRLRLRVRPTGAYPDSPPGKAVSARNVAGGSSFARRIAAVDTTQPISPELLHKLRNAGLQ